jgi:hypothetical protein
MDPALYVAGIVLMVLFLVLLSVCLFAYLLPAEDSSCDSDDESDIELDF